MGTENLLHVFYGYLLKFVIFWREREIEYSGYVPFYARWSLKVDSTGPYLLKNSREQNLSS
jgi:hypothetical protein